jgi:RNA polymerase-binding transcription factor DksA
VKKAAPAKKVAPVTKAAPVKKAAPAKKAAPVKKAAPAKKKLAVREDESPWSPAEIAEVRTALDADAIRLAEEIAITDADIAELIADSGDGAGDDQADTGSKTFEREHEMSLANNARNMLQQTEHALARIDNGTYGICEVCSRPVGKFRLQAFPRATMCKACKEVEERRAY